MPAWSSGALKLLRNFSNAERRPSFDNESNRKNSGTSSIDVHVHTRHSIFVEPPSVPGCGHMGHRYHLPAPYMVSNYEKNGNKSKARPRPLSILRSLPSLPIIAFQDSELLGSRTDLLFGNVVEEPRVGGNEDDKEKARRRYGMQQYPEGVRAELRRAHTWSMSPMDILNGEDSPSVYSNRSGYGEQITVSSAYWEGAEPRSRFSDNSISEEDALDPSGDVSASRVQSILAVAAGNEAVAYSGAGTSSNLAPPLLATAKSWQTFRIPSIPPSPVDSVPSPLPVLRRDPRLPPADYILNKDVYDYAMIKLNGSLPDEWVAYARRHYDNRV
ncbi:hypothetical protein BDV93DRAFT_556267 [Ceratobasidium sp. AG-I]|nr:hypothetical protein BDV93DRAFT_556267 [Ceratobasidium sp. AG-I]